MKRILWTVALCIAATGAFAQKKAVKEAQSIAKGSNPDFTEARTIINGALENPETKEERTLKLGLSLVLSRTSSLAPSRLSR